MSVDPVHVLVRQSAFPVDKSAGATRNSEHKQNTHLCPSPFTKVIHTLDSNDLVPEQRRVPRDSSPRPEAFDTYDSAAAECDVGTTIRTSSTWPDWWCHHVKLRKGRHSCSCSSKPAPDLVHALPAPEGQVRQTAAMFVLREVGRTMRAGYPGTETSKAQCTGGLFDPESTASGERGEKLWRCCRGY